MLTDEEAARVVGNELTSADGQDLGSVESVLTHSADNRAAWAIAVVRDRRVLVPLDQARSEGERLLVRYDAETIASAPGYEGETLTADDTEPFMRHYGIDDSALRDDSGFATEQGRREHGSSRDPRGPAATDVHGHP